MGKNITISDVARHLGISKSTVSHALSGTRPISEELCRKIHQAVNELGYKPNFAAQVMNTNRTGLIGIIISGLANTHTTELVEAFSAALSKRQMQMILAIAATQIEGVELLQRFSRGMADAVINTLPDLHENVVQNITGSVPCLTYLRHEEAKLEIDFASGTREAFEYLVANGHRRIAIMASRTRCDLSVASDPCLVEYRKMAALHGCDEIVIPMKDGTIAEGVALADKLFATGATAVLAGNDMCALGIMQRSFELGKCLPRDLSIIGHDDAPTAQMSLPRLTSIRLPGEILARHTVEVLLHRVNPALPLPRARTVATKLIVRDSVGKKN